MMRNPSSTNFPTSSGGRPYLGTRFLGEEELAYLREVIERQGLFRYSGIRSAVLDAERALGKALAHQSHDAPDVLCMNSATSALKVALLALSPKPGDLVFIPAISYIATAAVCLSAGLVPILVDTDERGGMSPAALRTAFDRHRDYRVVAIVVVHMDGAAACIEEIVDVGREKDVPVFEDCAQALGVTIRGQSVGTFGLAGCFSFQDNKLLVTGDGGALISQDAAFMRKARALSDHGAERPDGQWPSWQNDNGFGENFRMNELTGAVLLAQVERLAGIRSALHIAETELIGEVKSTITLEIRPTGEMPVSLWIDDDVKAEELRSRGYYLYNWRHWYLPLHPILMERRSPYGDAFPWSLMPDIQQHDCPNALRLITKRFCLPVVPAALTRHSTSN